MASWQVLINKNKHKNLGINLQKENTLESPKSSKSPKSRGSEEKKVKFIEGLPLMDFKTRFNRTSKFENYSKRKFIIDENKVNKINTYQNPFNYSETIKKNSKKKPPYNIPTINIKKYPSRNYTGLINPSNFPTPTTYFPNFQLTQPKVKSGNESFN